MYNQNSVLKKIKFNKKFTFTVKIRIVNKNLQFYIRIYLNLLDLNSDLKVYQRTFIRTFFFVSFLSLEI